MSFFNASILDSRSTIWEFEGELAEVDAPLEGTGIDVVEDGDDDDIGEDKRKGECDDTGDTRGTVATMDEDGILSAEWLESWAFASHVALNV